MELEKEMDLEQEISFMKEIEPLHTLKFELEEKIIMWIASIILVSIILLSVVSSYFSYLILENLLSLFNGHSVLATSLTAFVIFVSSFVLLFKKLDKLFFKNEKLFEFVINKILIKVNKKMSNPSLNKESYNFILKKQELYKDYLLSMRPEAGSEKSVYFEEQFSKFIKHIDNKHLISSAENIINIHNDFSNKKNNFGKFDIKNLL